MIYKALNISLSHSVEYVESNDIFKNAHNLYHYIFNYMYFITLMQHM